MVLSRRYGGCRTVNGRYKVGLAFPGRTASFFERLAGSLAGLVGRDIGLQRIYDIRVERSGRLIQLPEQGGHVVLQAQGAQQTVLSSCGGSIRVVPSANMAILPAAVFMAQNPALTARPPR